MKSKYELEISILRKEETCLVFLSALSKQRDYCTWLSNMNFLGQYLPEGFKLPDDSNEPLELSHADAMHLIAEVIKDWDKWCDVIDQERIDNGD